MKMCGVCEKGDEEEEDKQSLLQVDRGRGVNTVSVAEKLEVMRSGPRHVRIGKGCLWGASSSLDFHMQTRVFIHVSDMRRKTCFEILCVRVLHR